MSGSPRNFSVSPSPKNENVSPNNYITSSTHRISSPVTVSTTHRFSNPNQRTDSPIKITEKVSSYKASNYISSDHNRSSPSNITRRTTSPGKTKYHYKHTHLFQYVNYYYNCILNYIILV